MSRQFKSGIKSSQARRARPSQQYRQNRRNTRINKYRSFVPRTMGPFAQTESKYFDSFLDSTAIAEGIDWTGTELDPTSLSLFTPIEGSDIDNRIGRKVSLYKLSLRGLISSSALSDQADILAVPFVRLILFMDMQTNGTQAQGEQVMSSPGTTSIFLNVNTFQNPANFGRFRVLRDKTYKLGISTAQTDGTNTSSQAHPVVPFKMTVKFNTPIDIRFNATSGGTIGDIVDNSFHLIGTKSSAAYASIIAYQCRGYYKDK